MAFRGGNRLDCSCIRGRRAARARRGVGAARRRARGRPAGRRPAGPPLRRRWDREERARPPAKTVAGPASSSTLVTQLSLARTATLKYWVFTAKPAKPPLPGARYGSFGAGCHYTDGSFVPADTQEACPKTDPQTGAAFSFWHPVLVTLHVWLWYPNPTGLFASTNPLVSPFNNG
jgi:hypothetical protein